MKKIRHFLNITYMSTLLFGTASIQNMNRNYTEQTSQAEEYNYNDCPLIQLPDEKLVDIFSHCLIHDENQVESLKNSIKGFMRIIPTCKHFNTLLTFKMIGKFCKQYTEEEKNALLIDLINATTYWTYKTNRLPKLILVCAGADANSEGKYQDSLIAKPIADNDIEFVEVMLQHNANPNKICTRLKGAMREDPLLFNARTKCMVELLYKYGLDVHATSQSHGYNILWEAIEAGDPVELMQFYLDHQVDIRQLDIWNNDCLFHRVMWNNDNDDRMKKIQLLLTMIPDMINHQNNQGKTPLDELQFRESDIGGLYVHEIRENYNQLSILLKQHGALTAEQLKQQATLL